MITQCAPLDSLIQRFGRVNRTRTPNSIRKHKPVHVIAPQDMTLPYKKEVLNKSFKQLPDMGETLHERDIQTKIDKVYSELDLKEIEIHLIYKNGTYTLKELTSNKKAVLVEALEIESACCILEEDRENYLEAEWEDRVHMEIPINWKTIARHRNEYEQIQVGANPFVIPQNPDDYKLYGLQLVEHNKFL